MEGDPKFEASQDLPDFPYARFADRPVVLEVLPTLMRRSTSPSIRQAPIDRRFCRVIRIRLLLARRPLNSFLPGDTEDHEPNNPALTSMARAAVEIQCSALYLDCRAVVTGVALLVYLSIGAAASSSCPTKPKASRRPLSLRHRPRLGHKPFVYL